MKVRQVSAVTARSPTEKNDRQEDRKRRSEGKKKNELM